MAVVGAALWTGGQDAHIRTYDADANQLRDLSGSHTGGILALVVASGAPPSLPLSLFLSSSLSLSLCGDCYFMLVLSALPLFLSLFLLAFLFIHPLIFNPLHPLRRARVERRGGRVDLCMAA